MRFIQQLLILLLVLTPCHAQELAFKPGSISMGEMLQQTKTSGSFQIANNGNAVVTITEVKSNCGCTTALPEKQKLAPGESTKLHVTFDAGFFLGRQEKQIFVHTDEPHRYILFVYADVVKPYSTDPSVVVFKDAEGVVEQVLRLRSNMTEKQITVEKIVVGDDCLSAAVLDEGRIRLRADLGDNSPESTAMDIYIAEMPEPITVPIHIKRTTRFKVVPSVLTLMGIREGTEVRRIVRISGEADRLMLRNWECDVPFVIVEGIKKTRVGAEITIVTDPDKMKPGFGKGTLTVTLDIGSAEPETVEIPIAYNLFASIK